MRVRGLFVSMIVALIAIPVFAADPAAGKIDGWTRIAPGVSQRMENGGRHIHATGRDGLVWEINNQEALLRKTVTRADLSPEERGKRLNIIMKRLIRLRAILDEMPSEDEATIQTLDTCSPSLVFVKAQTTPYSGAGIHGSLAWVQFDATNCEETYGWGGVYAYCLGSLTGVVEDEDSVTASQTFDILASATGADNSDPYCDYAWAYAWWMDGQHHSSPVTDTYEFPPGCF